jgi:hypothetical protein
MAIILRVVGCIFTALGLMCIMTENQPKSTEYIGFALILGGTFLIWQPYRRDWHASKPGTVAQFFRPQIVSLLRGRTTGQGIKLLSLNAVLMASAGVMFSTGNERVLTASALVFWVACTWLLIFSGKVRE